MTVLAIVVPAVVIFAFSTFRRLWLLSAVEEYALKAAYWVWRTDQSDQVRGEASQMWPINRIVWDSFHWTLRYYLVHQEHHDAMDAFIAEQLMREDLDMAAMAQMVASDLEKQLESKAEPAPEDDTSSSINSDR